MYVSHAKILEIRQTYAGVRTALLFLPEGHLPKAGQYVQAHRPQDEDVPAPVSLFAGGWSRDALPADTFTTAPHIPSAWQPGDTLLVRGPLGRGFALPEQARRVALGVLDGYSDVLLPLLGEVFARDGEAALFLTGDFPALPSRVEVNPLQDLPDAFGWADYIALSGSLEAVAQAQNTFFNLAAKCPVQVLARSEMPCGGMAQCGVCALIGKRRKVLLPCEDGPVFDVGELRN